MHCTDGNNDVLSQIVTSGRHSQFCTWLFTWKVTKKFGERKNFVAIEVQTLSHLRTADWSQREVGRDWIVSETAPNHTVHLWWRILAPSQAQPMGGLEEDFWLALKRFCHAARWRKGQQVLSKAVLGRKRKLLTLIVNIVGWCKEQGTLYYKERLNLQTHPLWRWQSWRRGKHKATSIHLDETTHVMQQECQCNGFWQKNTRFLHVIQSLYN